MADGQTSPNEETGIVNSRPAVVVVVPPARDRVPMAPFKRSLPAVVAERLPALWDGGRGPLAQAVMAGGLLALGSVMGRLAASEASTALTPSRRGVAPALPAAPPRRTQVVVETAMIEARAGRWGRRPKQVQIVQQRVTVVHE